MQYKIEGVFLFMRIDEEIEKNFEIIFDDKKVLQQNSEIKKIEIKMEKRNSSPTSSNIRTNSTFSTCRPQLTFSSRWKPFSRVLTKVVDEIDNFLQKLNLYFMRDFPERQYPVLGVNMGTSQKSKEEKKEN